MRQSIYQIENRRISFCDVANITGNENVDTFHFDFDSEWDVFNDKYLVLNVDGKSYIDKLDSNNNVVLRSVAYDNDNVTFGVYGIHENAKLSTNIVWLETIPSIFGQIKEVDGVPSKTVWELYTEEMLALLAQGQITLEQCQNVLSDVQDVKALIEQLKRDVEQDKVDVTLLKSQIEASIAEINRKILAFDSNYAEKLQAFNDNFDTKLAEIVSKCDDFDEDYAEKTQNFNENVSNKTQSFNDNYTQKLGNINTAGSTQVANVNQAGATQKANVEGAGSTAVENVNTAKTNALSAISTAEGTATGNITQAGTTTVANVERAEEEAIAHIQEEGASYDERLDDLELLASNFDENTTEPSDDITIEDALNAKAKISVLGKTKQDTYRGVNLWSAGDKSFTQEASVNISLDAGTYTMSADITSEAPTNRNIVFLYDGNTTKSIYFSSTDKSKTLTLTSHVKKVYLRSGEDYNASAGYSATYKNIQIEAGSTATEYEPYVGGQASPSPSYPQEMENVSGSSTIDVNNKNFAGPIQGEATSNGITAKVEKKSIKISGTGTQENTFAFLGNSITRVSRYYQAVTLSTSNAIKLNPGTYVLDYTVSSSSILAFYGNLGSRLDASTSITKGTSFTITETKYLFLGMYTWVGNVNVTISNLQLGKGTSATSYEPHKGKTFQLTLPEGMDLREVGNYRDMLFKNIEGSKYYNKNLALGKWFWHKEIIQRKLDNLNFNRSVLSSGNVVFSVNLGYRGITSEICVLSSHFKGIPDSYGNVLNSIRIASSGNCFIIVPDEERFATVTSFKSWLTEENVIAQFILKNADVTNTEITDSTLLAQLEELEQMETYKNITHIYATSEGLAPNLEVKYLVDDRVEINSRLKALEQAVVAQNSNN